MNNIFHQSMAPVEQKEYFYQWPYTVFGDTFENVLILGAGSGTDVAAALTHGAKHVDAVEIDPAIMRLGPRAAIPISRIRDPRVTRDQRRRAALPADDDQEVRPGGVRADRLADACSRASRACGSRATCSPRSRSARSAIGSTPNGLLVVYNYFRERWLVDRLANTAAAAFGAGAARARARSARLSRRDAGRAAAGDADRRSASCRTGSPPSTSRTRRPGAHARSAIRRSSRRPTTGRSSTCAIGTSRATTSSRWRSSWWCRRSSCCWATARPGRPLVVAVLPARRRLHAARDEVDHPVRAAVGIDLGRRVAGDRVGADDGAGRQLRRVDESRSAGRGWSAAVLVGAAGC